MAPRRATPSRAVRVICRATRARGRGTASAGRFGRAAEAGADGGVSVRVIGVRGRGEAASSAQAAASTLQQVRAWRSLMGTSFLGLGQALAASFFAILDASCPLRKDFHE